MANSGPSEIPIIPKAESISVHTGNIVNWNRFKRKIVQGPTEEVRSRLVLDICRFKGFSQIKCQHCHCDCESVRIFNLQSSINGFDPKRHLPYWACA